MQISPTNPVAYFCAEFGIESSIPIYAGGLGVLAGDTIKAAADKNYPMVAIGLLYRGEGSVQSLDENGMQVEGDMDFDPLTAGLEHVYLDEMPAFVKVHLTSVDVWTRCWKKTIGNNLTLYLLDTETDQNLKQERIITQALYSGSEESLMKQQLILGIGGVKLLHMLNIHPAIYHINEGRPAFLHWQLIRSYMKDHGLSYEEAMKMAKSKTVYTNHTLVSAGNESYNIHLLRGYGQYYAERMEISIDKLLEPGVQYQPENFVMTKFALNVSRKANGVSKLHTRFSQEHWPEYNWCNVTNGVHMPTWQKENIRTADPKNHQALWDAHLDNKRKLMEFVQEKTGIGYDPNHLIVSWARRIAKYKRPQDIFQDIGRLAAILKNQERPVHILMAGKAHASDTQAKMFLQEILHYMQNEIKGHAIFVPDYNIDVAKYLVSGSDVWLNTPEYGKEASGTSGMKAVSNGVLQCTVRDGWADEVEWHGMGWVLDHQNIQSSFYTLLEYEIAQMYYNRNEQGLPEEWLTRMERSIELSKNFSASRMLDEYIKVLYKE